MTRCSNNDLNIILVKYPERRDKYYSYLKKDTLMWQKHETCLFRLPSSHRELTKTTMNVAGFDLKNTLIHSDSGRLNIGTSDYVWYSDATPEYLHDISRAGWTIVIFSNGPEIKTIKDHKTRINNIIEYLGFEPYVYISLKSDSWAKPSPKIFHLFVEHTKIIVGSDSFYCGEKGCGFADPCYEQVEPPYRIGRTDREFAENCHLHFKFPFEVLPNQPTIEFSPPSLDTDQYLVIMVGQPGSGKSTFSRKLEKIGFIRVTKEDKKYMTMIKNELHGGKSIVFDAMNPSRADREPLINLAKQYGASPYIIWSTRNGRPYNDLRTGKERVSSIVYNIYTSKFERPTNNEAIVYRIT